MSTSEYLRFAERPKTILDARKTKIIDVISVRSGDVLGEIRWYSRWRQYAFWPRTGTIWNPDCLRAVEVKINNLMEMRKQERKGTTT